MSDCRLILGDALDTLRSLPDGSIDHIVTDPPYGQTNESYDRGVDAAVWRECYRVARPDAALISFAGSPTYHRIASDIEAAGWKVRQMWGWVYRDGMITSAWPKEGFDRLAPAMDPIVFATKGKVLLRVEREGDAAWRKVGGPDVPGLSGRSKGPPSRTGVGRYPRALASDGTPPFEYFALARTHGGATGRTGHPNQKPLALMRWILAKLPTNGRPILDPFAGSGTTLLAALLEGHRAVGIESDPDYFAIAERRIAAARASNAAETPLFAGHA